LIHRGEVLVAAVDGETARARGVSQPPAAGPRRRSGYTSRMTRTAGSVTVMDFESTAAAKKIRETA
jgi:hypothetical protein